MRKTSLSSYFRSQQRTRKRFGTAHPGFERVAQSIARRGGYSMKRARAILAARTRKASAAAKRANPRLKRVRG